MIARALAILLLVVLPSCLTASLEYSPVHSDDAIVWLRWTIDGRDDERSCPAFNATAARIVIQRSDGTVARTAEPPCDDFSSRHVLDPGSYTVSISLLDESRRVVAEPRTVAFVVARGHNAFIDVAFATPGPS
jgi:hypothetical protein